MCPCMRTDASLSSLSSPSCQWGQRVCTNGSAGLLLLLLSGCIPGCSAGTGSPARAGRTGDVPVPGSRGDLPDTVPLRGIMPPPPAAPQPPLQPPLRPGFTWALRVEPATVHRGRPVTLRLVLRNDSARKPVLMVAGSREQAFDFVISDSAGRLVWNRIRSDVDLRGVGLPVARGDSIVFSSRWDQRDTTGSRVEAGTYWVRGYLSPRLPNTHGTAAERLVIRP